MSQSSKSPLLVEQINLLVKHFGVKRVRAAIAKVKVEGEEISSAATRPVRSQRLISANGTSVIEPIREVDPEKYRLLLEFLLRLKERRVLPESQDIRYFANVIGLKEISGKSRDDLVSKLMRFLVEQPTDKLRTDINGAGDISERQRQRGYSVLTDKLLGKSS